MNKPVSHFSFPQRLAAGQGLVEYAILIAIVGLLTLAGLSLLGGSVQGGFIKVCAALGNDDCQAVEGEVAVAVSTPTPILQVSVTPSLIPTATPTLSEPDPTRAPALTMVAVVPTSTVAAELKTMRIKVVLNGKDDEKKRKGILVVIYNSAGEYVTEGKTDEKGKVSFSVASGDYIVATFYDKVWQKDGPFSVTNSREYVIHRNDRDGDDDDDDD